jgi:hypothetical protein
MHPTWQNSCLRSKLQGHMRRWLAASHNPMQQAGSSPLLSPGYVVTTLSPGVSSTRMVRYTPAQQRETESAHAAQPTLCCSTRMVRYTTEQASRHHLTQHMGYNPQASACHGSTNKLECSAGHWCCTQSLAPSDTDKRTTAQLLLQPARQAESFSWFEYASCRCAPSCGKHTSNGCCCSQIDHEK